VNAEGKLGIEAGKPQSRQENLEVKLGNQEVNPEVKQDT